MSDFIYMSKAALDKLKEELHEMKAVKRPALSQKISDARDFGDLKENAEYHAARESLSLLETKIGQMEESLRRARLVDPKNISTEMVSLYTRVRLKDLSRNTEMSFTLVSQEESDFRQKKVSILSPLGKALIGKKPGEVAEFSAPAGTMRYEVLKIEVAI